MSWLFLEAHRRRGPLEGKKNREGEREREREGVRRWKIYSLYMGDTPDERRGLYGQRPSRSHDAFRREEFARIARLTPIERMIEALELSEELEEVDPRASEEEEEGSEEP